MNKFFVVNLPFTLTADGFKDAIASVLQSEVKVHLPKFMIRRKDNPNELMDTGKNRGFGFFETDMLPKDVLALFDKFELQGRLVQVRVADNRPRGNSTAQTTFDKQRPGIRSYHQNSQQPVRYGEGTREYVHRETDRNDRRKRHH